MADVDQHVQIVELLDDLVAEVGQARLVSLCAAVAHQVAQVVCELHHAQPQVVEQVDAPEVASEGSRVLEVEYYPPDAVAVDALDVVRRQDEPDLVVEGVDHRPRLRHGGEGGLEGGLRGSGPA